MQFTSMHSNEQQTTPWSEFLIYKEAFHELNIHQDQSNNNNNNVFLFLQVAL